MGKGGKREPSFLSSSSPSLFLFYIIITVINITDVFGFEQIFWQDCHTLASVELYFDWFYQDQFRVPLASIFGPVMQKIKSAWSSIIKCTRITIHNMSNSIKPESESRWWSYSKLDKITSFVCDRCLMNPLP